MLQETQPELFDLTGIQQIPTEVQKLPTERQMAVEKRSRDDDGLIKGIDYVFNDDGSVNWRSMIKKQFLYVNKEFFERNNKPVPESIEGLDDRQLLVMLGGLKEVANLRGYSDVSFKVEHHKELAYVSASCKIAWIPNYESDWRGVSYEDFANASTDNTEPFCHSYLEAIACNRAFARCVRNSLGIHVVGFDEVGVAERIEDKPTNVATKPQDVLKNKAGSKNFKTFDEFKSGFLANYAKRDDSWSDFSVIPAKDCRILLALLDKV